MSTPQTTIYLCSGVRLNSRYEHSVYFPSKTRQDLYFSGKVVKTLPAYSFVRRSWALKVEAEYTEAVKWNYLYFRYPSDRKFYYYFINKVEYINDSTVELTLELDLIQTYLFDDDFKLLECMIEREHVADDTLGLHTVEEGLETGHYQDTNERILADGCTDGDAILILSTFNPMTTTSDTNAVTTGGVYNGIYSGLGLYAVAIEDADKLTDKLDTLSSLNLIDGIVTMWQYPRELIRLAGEQTWSGGDLWCKNVDGIYNNKTFNYTSNLYIEGERGAIRYEPKNNKLLCYPYNVLYISNNAGNSAEYRFERFNAHNVASFNLIGGLSPDSSVRLIPTHYNGVSSASKLSNDYGISLAPYPTCAWNADTYKIWLAQNGYKIDQQKTSANLTAAGGALSVGIAVVGALTGGIGLLAAGGMAVGGASAILNGGMKAHSAIAQQEVASTQPDQARGSFSPNINAANGLQIFTAIQKQITIERARIIDDYFTMYGYKVARMGVPSLHNRKKFTYVKTIGCHAVGNVTNEDISKIEAIFDKGITFWTHDAVIGDYTVDNPTL